MPTPSWAPSMRPGISARMKLAFVHGCHTEIRMESGERIVGNFGTCACHSREEVGRAGVRQAHETASAITA